MSWRRSKRKTLNSCFLPSSLCSSQERVPCDLPDPSLWLTEGTTAPLLSPLTWLCAPPPPHRHHHHLPAARPPARLTVAPLPGGKDGGEGERGATSRRDSPSGFSSVPGHCTLLAGILFTHTHKHAYTHTSTQSQMTINGCDNVVCVFGCTVFKNNLFCGRSPEVGN